MIKRTRKTGQTQKFTHIKTFINKHKNLWRDQSIRNWKADSIFQSFELETNDQIIRIF